MTCRWGPSFLLLLCHQQKWRSERFGCGGFIGASTPRPSCAEDLATCVAFFTYPRDTETQRLADIGSNCIPFERLISDRSVVAADTLSPHIARRIRILWEGWLSRSGDRPKMHSLCYGSRGSRSRHPASRDTCASLRIVGRDATPDLSQNRIGQNASVTPGINRRLDV